MTSLLSAVETRPRESKLPSWSKKTLFAKAKPSDEWHQQIDFTAGVFHPSDHRFPWTLVRRHTDYYIKKKGKLTQAEIDLKLASLIDGHDTRDVAIAASAHAMSPTAVRALLNVELHVARATFFGLEMFLQSVIAANLSNPNSVTRLEAYWAERLLPYAMHGTRAAGRYLEGFCVILKTTDTSDLNGLPDFSTLARRALKSFAAQLEGMTLRCDWVGAYATVAWISTLDHRAPAAPPVKVLTPEYLLDNQFPLWRIWANWKPNHDRISLLSSINVARRGVLPDMLALEGPDFINGTHATLRDGLIAQYGAAKPLVRFRGLIIELHSCTKEELKKTLDRTGAALEVALNGGDGPFKLFVQLFVMRPITQEALQVFEAVSKIDDAPLFGIHKAVREVYVSQDSIGAKNKAALLHLIHALDDPNGEELRKVLLRPWLVQGIENCVKECQAAVRKHIDTRLPWTHLALELHSFFSAVKSSKNCLTLLEDKIQKQLDVLPAQDLLDQVVDIYKVAGDEKSTGTTLDTNALKGSIEAWCIENLMERWTASPASHRTVDAIVNVWNNTASTDKGNAERRSLAILTAQNAGTDFILRCRCLNQIVELPDELMRSLLTVLQTFKEVPEISCIEFTKLLAKLDIIIAELWKNILYKMLESLQPTAIIDYMLQQFKAWEWSQVMLDLNCLFAEVTMNPKEAPPFILQSHLHLWAQELSTYLPAITRLEEALGQHSLAVQVILKGGEGLWVEYLVKVLKALTRVSEQPVEPLMQKVVGKLAYESKNAPDIAHCVEALLGTTPEGFVVCERVWGLELDVVNEKYVEKQEPSKIPSQIIRKPLPVKGAGMPIAAAEVFVAGWLQDDDMLETDKTAITALATLLNLESYKHEIPKEKLEEATIYFEEQAAKLIEEAERLDGVQKALKARDPMGTAILLEQLGIQDISPLDEELESLPVGIAGAVEKKGQNEVEISFPLFSYTELQRSAMGAGAANTLLVRLFLDYTGQAPQSFCVHLDTDTRDFGVDHTPWECLSNGKSPEQAYCLGKASPFTWQMSRTLDRYMRSSGADIADLYGFVKSRMEELVHSCTVCGQMHNTRNVQLRRSIPCTLGSCTRIWNNTSLDIRVPEFRTDIFAVDMILTTVYAAAMSGRTELLPGCPITNTAAVQAVLNALPGLSNLRNITNLSATLRTYHKDAERLIIWALTHFRGFITTAAGICKIPSMPVGTHQFVLANANPKIEADFASKLSRHNPETKVLFHGTSLDRLPSILAQGLRIHSGTSLQRTGAAHGKGIYMAEEPATSFSYSPSAVSWKNSGLNNMRLLLGCEVAGQGRSVSPGIHVLTDEKSVIVRYVFLMLGSAYAPNSAHIVPAMGSAMSALRTGAV